MDFTKFLSLLYKKSLFFTRVDKFNDPFEGSLSKTNVTPSLSEFYKSFAKFTYVSCWHLGYQSATLWEAYLQSCNGVAIRSTFGKLRDSFFDPTKSQVAIGKVTYIDYKTDSMPDGPLYPYFHKRKNFRDERELRAIIQKFPYKENGEIDWDNSPYINGMFVKVDLKTLIDKIYLAPRCQEWQVRIVRKVVQECGLDKEVLKSKIYDRAQVV